MVHMATRAWAHSRPGTPQKHRDTIYEGVWKGTESERRDGRGFNLAEFLLHVGVDVDVIHAVRHFLLPRRCLRETAPNNGAGGGAPWWTFVGIATRRCPRWTLPMSI